MIFTGPATASIDGGYEYVETLLLCILYSLRLHALDVRRYPSLLWTERLHSECSYPSWNDLGRSRPPPPRHGAQSATFIRHRSLIRPTLPSLCCKGEASREEEGGE